MDSPPRPVVLGDDQGPRKKKQRLCTAETAEQVLAVGPPEIPFAPVFELVPPPPSVTSPEALQPNVENANVQAAAAVAAADCVRLHGGLGVWQPPEWRLTDDVDALHHMLREDGVAAVVDVITAEQADDFAEGMRRALTQCNEQWGSNANAAPSPGTRGHGLQKYYGVALCEASQQIRIHPNIRRVYEALFRCSDLVGSVDAPIVVTPHTLASRKRCKDMFRGSSLKPHVDMTSDGPSRRLVQHLQQVPGAFPCCVQGAVVCQDQIPRECGGKLMAPPGFVAMPGEQPPLQPGAKEFRILSDEELDVHNVLARCRYVSAQKGTLLLWRSDVVHNSYGGDPELFPIVHDSFCRLVQTVCMCPRSVRAPDARELKESMWDTEEKRLEREMQDVKKVKRPKPGACTSHYPHKCVWNGCGPGHYSNRAQGDPAHWNTLQAPLLEGQRAIL